MRVAIIGRSQLLYETAVLLRQHSFEIPLIITAKEAPEYTRTAADFEQLANSCGAIFIHTPKVNLEKYKKQIRELSPIDIGVSINYTGVISQEVIDFFPLGILNAHAGDLPRYRGNAPLAWAIINKEISAGLCIHRMIGGELDSGNILAKDHYQLSIDTKVGDLFTWIENRIPELMLEAIEHIRKDPVYLGETQSKDPLRALRCYPRLPEDGRIDWKASAEDVVRLVNASSEPFGGAFCQYNGEKMIIWRASLFQDAEIYSAIPGQVAAVAEDRSLIVITGNGKIKVSEVEYQGQRGLPGLIIKSIRTRLQ